MIREVYQDRKEFELKFMPERPKKPGLLSLENPERFITDHHIKRWGYSPGFQDSVPSKISFECNLLLTNPFHDGIWLYMDNEHRGIEIPGSCITEEDWEYVNTNPYYVIMEALIRTMRDLDESYRNQALIDPILSMMEKPSTLAELEDLLHFVTGRVGFKVHNPEKHPLLYYQYWLYPSWSKKPIELDRFKIYALLEVSEPKFQIPAFENYTSNGFLWYSRRDHKYNRSMSGGRNCRKVTFQSTYRSDIRISDSGVDILDNIFSTESIFGKLDIY